ncbi:MAG: type IIL restriction-modification enzyme MmeI, partial [Alphaproteobacteria bacterium]
FYGIEIEEFPAHIAEAAMWLTDHQMNMKLSESFGQALTRLPLKKSANITHGNALTTDWKDVIAPSKLSYMLGNPPFVGYKYQNEEQHADMSKVFHFAKGSGVLDYVTAWYWKATQYIQGTRIKVAFVSTNSITQGEQVGILWQPMLLHYGIHIHFAHRTFKWTIDEKKAKGMKIAAVHCVIVGFANYAAESNVLFDYEKPTSEPHRVEAKNINPYLVDAPNNFIIKRTSPISDVPKIDYGSEPREGGYLILSDNEKTELISENVENLKWIRKFVSADDYLNNLSRWCLWLVDANPSEIKKSKIITNRLKQVADFREKSLQKAANKASDTPSLFVSIRQPTSKYLLIPIVSSERRMYIPIGYVDEKIIVSNACFALPNATLYHFGVLTSLMHMDWMRHVCGRLKSDYRYSNTLVYNNFPWPSAPKPEQIKIIEEKAKCVLDARAAFPSSTLADLYDPLTMPPSLLKAHQALDKAVDAAYRKQPFISERERIEYLFAEYQRLTAPLIGAMNAKKRRKK